VGKLTERAVALATTSEIGELIAAALTIETIMIITTKDEDLHSMYWAEAAGDQKIITYRGRDLRTFDDGVIHAGAYTSEEGCNTPGLLWLERVRAPPTKFGYNATYKKEWGWTRDLHKKGYVGYRICKRLRFRKWISLSYGTGPKKAKWSHLTAIHRALELLIEHHETE
jgi:hypothetical protein